MNCIMIENTMDLIKKAEKLQSGGHVWKAVEVYKDFINKAKKVSDETDDLELKTDFLQKITSFNHRINKIEHHFENFKKNSIILQRCGYPPSMAKLEEMVHSHKVKEAFIIDFVPINVKSMKLYVRLFNKWKSQCPSLTFIRLHMKRSRSSDDKAQKTFLETLQKRMGRIGIDLVYNLDVHVETNDGATIYLNTGTVYELDRSMYDVYCHRINNNTPCNITKWNTNSYNICRILVGRIDRF